MAVWPGKAALEELQATFQDSLEMAADPENCGQIRTAVLVTTGSSETPDDERVKLGKERSA